MNAAQIAELKSRILSMAAELRANFNQHNAQILNGACRDLLAATGEVFSNGSFVKVA
ncbi:hypothetical protein [Burkholderia ubonensis]|uniref:hypothetical protein n=1 Tax=Burkholderia ubonensis TaxID=101571 RepID=UPI000A986A23|nr:hypothetical protein [Burkholderia ubonensis]